MPASMPWSAPHALRPESLQATPADILMDQGTPLHTGRSEFQRGIRDTFPLVLGAIPFGIVFGAVAITSGFSVAGTIGLSTLVFAGSAQFIAIGLVAQGVPGALIILTTFVVNLRHALYAASLGPYLRGLPQRWIAPLAFWLTDETYAVVIRRYSEGDGSPLKHWYYLGSAVFMYVNWQVCTIIGIFAGQRLRNLSELGLDFAMVVSFSRYRGAFYHQPGHACLCSGRRLLFGAGTGCSQQAGPADSFAAGDRGRHAVRMVVGTGGG